MTYSLFHSAENAVLMSIKYIFMLHLSLNIPDRITGSSPLQLYLIPEVGCPSYNYLVSHSVIASVTLTLIYAVG